MGSFIDDIQVALGMKKSTTQKVLEGAFWTTTVLAAGAAAKKLTEDKTPKVSASSANKMKKRGSK